MFSVRPTPHILRQGRLRHLGTPLVLGLVVSAPSPARPVPAGTEIANVASVDGLIDAQPFHAVSNVARLRVDEILDVALQAVAGDVPADNDGSIPARLFNRGNGAEAFRLEAAAGPRVRVTGLAIDTDGNGVFDAGTDMRLGTDAVTAPIAASSAATILILFRVDGDTFVDDLGSITLVASAVTGTGQTGSSFAGRADGGGDAVVGHTSARAEVVLPLVADALTATLTKSQRVLDPQGGEAPVAGAVITYTLSASFTGRGSLRDVRVTDPVPSGTRYVAGSLLLDGSPLADGDGRSIDVALGTITSPATHTVTFQAAIQ